MPQNVGSKASHSSIKENSKSISINDDSPVNFIYKTMVERDPKKRKVKPIEKGYDLLSLELLEDSSSDEEYQPKNLDNDDDDDENEDDDDDDEDDDADEEEDFVENGAEHSLTENADEVRIVAVENSLYKASFSPNQTPDLASAKIDFPTKVSKLLVCSVCLGDVSHENDEIVECDSCGITVHEGCYGITGETDNDNESVHSNASSSSTEPWFCDACKAYINSPSCELCPNVGGIYKQTDAGRWVHLVCALYIPGVAFADTTHLTGVTLFELSYDRWGSKPCSLCEDERLSRTGISICCDAGMCKTHFHVTCAQAQGLLYEAQNSDETELVDPFYAHCKLHAGDKSGVKAKRRNWLALQSKQRFRNDKQSAVTLSERIVKKLTKAREKWKASDTKVSAPWVPTQKVPRMLTTSPSAVKKLIRKSELLGLSPQTQYIASHDIDVRRKWHIPPAFSVEFVSYYLDRNNRMNSMQKRLEELKSQSRQLKDVEAAIRKKYEELLKQCDSLKSEGIKHKAEAKELWIILNSLSKKNLAMPKLFECSEESKPPKSGKRSEKLSENRKKKNSPFTTSPEMSVLKSCGICHRTQDQHKLALCDSCKLNYHLYCLDPPLTRMPKKTRFGGWQCSDCTEKEDTQSDGNSNHSLVDSPRRLREHVKGPNKFIPDADISPSMGPLPLPGKKRRNNSHSGTRRGRSKKPKVKKDNNDSEDKQITENGSSNLSVSLDNGTSTPPRRSSTKQEEECCKCKNQAPLRLLVKCDGCLLFYHFSCLNPPVKKSPKQRGYRWFCENCDDSDASSALEDDEEEAEEEEEEDGEDSQDGDTQASSN